MKKRIAEFLEVEEAELKAIAIATLIAIAATPVVFKIVFAPAFWWIR